MHLRNISSLEITRFQIETIENLYCFREKIVHSLLVKLMRNNAIQHIHSMTNVLKGRVLINRAKNSYFIFL